MIIRTVELSDASEIADIYNHYILESTITFEETPIDGQDIAERILDLNAQSLPSFGEDIAVGYPQFDDHIKTLPSVKQSYHVSGPTDYILIVKGPNLQWYENWAKKHIMSFPAIKRHDTSVVWSCKKFETAISV